MSAAIGGMWAPLALRMARNAAFKATQLIRSRLASGLRQTGTAFEPALARNTPRQPIHPAALLRQQRSRRWHSTTAYHNVNAAVRRFMSTGRLDGVSHVDRSKYFITKTGRAISQSTGRAPFASTLRPNLTGGALPRTAGGYSLGSGRVGGQRYFSHSPCAQAHVVQNVSAAVRAFWISGYKAQFDGLNAQGEKRYRAVSTLHDETSRKLAAAPRSSAGSYIDFKLNPSVTALSPLGAAFPFPSATGVKAPALDVTTLNTEGFFDVLSVDFGRALMDLAATLTDLKKLSMLGDLPIRMENSHTIRVLFPGVDADTVECLCEDLGLTHGTVGEDSDFVAETGVTMALKFPFASTAEPSNKELTLTSPGGSLRSHDSFAEERELWEGFSGLGDENPWFRSLDGAEEEPEGYASMSPPMSSGEHCSSEDFEGLEGVYRFLEECDRARSRF